MNPILIVGTIIVNMALISYSFFIYNERKYRLINNKVLFYLSLGVLLDISATVCMIIGSSKGIFTIHGLIGYSSLTGMIIDVILLWNSKYKNGIHSPIKFSIHTYSLIAYSWWIFAYISGALIVMSR